MYDELPVRILANAERFPARTAYVFENRSISYGQLAEYSRSLGYYLSKDRSPVVIYGHKSPEFIICILACLISGRCYIPCDTSIPVSRVKKLANPSGADMLIFTEEGDCPGILSCELSRKELRECFSHEGISPVTSGDENAYIIFTSGSTGDPKGIPVRRESLMNFCGYADSFLCGAVHTGHALFSFDLSVADIFPTLLSGGTLIETDGIPLSDTDSLVCTPTFLRLCLLSDRFTEINLPSLKTVLCCGEVLPADTAEKLFERFGDIRLINAYGPAECCCFVSAYEVKKGDNAPLPVGNCKNACNIGIRNGEIFISGASVSRGYISPCGNDSFRDGGYYTGDMGEIRDGMLYFLGRKGGFVKRSGYRIELSETESEIRQINGVSDCICIAVPDGMGQARSIKAFVILSEDISPVQIKQQLALRLPAYMLPNVIKAVPYFPLTPNGKIDYKALDDK